MLLVGIMFICHTHTARRHDTRTQMWTGHMKTAQTNTQHDNKALFMTIKLLALPFMSKEKPICVTSYSVFATNHWQCMIRWIILTCLFLYSHMHTDFQVSLMCKVLVYGAMHKIHSGKQKLGRNTTTVNRQTWRVLQHLSIVVSQKQHILQLQNNILTGHGTSNFTYKMKAGCCTVLQC